ncbi:hypothetical protein EJB05_29943, partial [Eragrostis curvula]
MYYLCVVYLDYLDFAHRTLPPPTIPRIKVWKQDMIKVFSDLDCSEGHNYGQRPVKDFSATCYNKRPDPDNFKVNLDHTVGHSFSPK